MSAEGNAPAGDKDRGAFVAGIDLDPGSLVGSWFHRLEGDEIVWEGVVVGEPQAGVYLCQIDRGAIPNGQQRIVGLREMVGDGADDGFEWRFFDTQEQAREAFVAWSFRATHELEKEGQHGDITEAA